MTNIPNIDGFQITQIDVRYSAAVDGVVTAPTPAPEPTPTPTEPDPVLTPDPEPIAWPDVTPQPAAELGFTVPRNGLAWFGPSVTNGWAKGSSLEYWIEKGARVIRYPIKRELCYSADGTMSDWVINHLVTMAKICLNANVAFIPDDHSYSKIGDPEVEAFWAELATRVEAGLGGYNPLFGIEWQNEPGGASTYWTEWGPGVVSAVKTVRDAGYQGNIFMGWGDWNNARQGVKALTIIEELGGVKAIDPLDRLMFTMHDYWSWSDDYGKRNNDRSPYVHGGISIEDRYGAVVAKARDMGAKIVMSEIGGGVTPTGPMQPFPGTGNKTGLDLQKEYLAFAKANEDTLIGTWWWAGGRMKDSYQHKVGEPNPQHLGMLMEQWNQ